MPAKTLMIQGTASNVGKSVVATALCRLFKRRGFHVAPFKAQNMSNNSYATASGDEIARAQAVQAEACGIEPTRLMNPILLKPTSDRKCQVVVMGKAVGNFSAQEYDRYKLDLAPIVENALRELMASYEIVVIEGAGSPAEVNIKEQDIANMRVAKWANAPVILVGDIDKGGVFAQLVGTYDLLDPEERERIKAFLINKFRGDQDILEPGLKWIEERTSRRVLGVLPFVSDLALQQEDSVVLEEEHLIDDHSHFGGQNPERLLIQVIRLPRISNFTDFEAFARESDVVLEYLHRPTRHYVPDLLVIPGSKSTTADLQFLKKSGFAGHIDRCAKAGTVVMGICGGYQMLGQRILDPEGVESEEASCQGLGLLPTLTTFERDKAVTQVKAVHLESQLEVKGYEIHMGRTRVNGARPLFKIIERNGISLESYEGVFSESSNSHAGPYVLGTYLHGIFDHFQFRRYFLNQIRRLRGLEASDATETTAQGSLEVDPYDRLAALAEAHLDMELLGEIVGENLYEYS